MLKRSKAARRGDGTIANLRLVATGADGTTVYGKIEAPIAFDTVLADDTRLRTLPASGVWETTVVQPGPESTLQAGDVVVGLVDSPAWTQGGPSLARVLAEEIQAGQASARFAVRRAGSMWVKRVTLVRQSG